MPLDPLIVIFLATATCQGNKRAIITLHECDDHFTCLLEVITDHPDDMTKYADKQAVFSCLATDVESFHWRVNGTDTESDNLTSQIKADLFKDYSKHGVFHISTLSVTARQWN